MSQWSCGFSLESDSPPEVVFSDAATASSVSSVSGFTRNQAVAPRFVSPVGGASRPPWNNSVRTWPPILTPSTSIPRHVYPKSTCLLEVLQEVWGSSCEDTTSQLQHAVDSSVEPMNVDGMWMLKWISPMQHAHLDTLETFCFLWTTSLA